MTHPRTPEFDRIAGAFGWSGDPSGVGDDAALLAGNRLLCCDALAEGVHFRWDWSTAEDVGWKAVAANVADILAMGGIPDTAVWSIGMGESWGDEIFAGLARGALEACATYGCSLVGGDTVRCTGPGFVSLSLLGTLRSSSPWKRSGVRAGDRLVLAGAVGDGAAGMAVMEAGLVDNPQWADLVAAYRRPRPQLPLISRLFALDIHGAIDLSDGLSSDAAHLAGASGVALSFDSSALVPTIAQRNLATSLGCDPLPWVLHGGEDHSLLLAVDANVVLPPGLWDVGQAELGAGVWLIESGKRRPLESRGWTHR